MIENYTLEEEDAISELRNRMQNELPQSVYEDKVLIYKFLKARNFNLRQSESMLRKCLQFRKAIQADTLIKEYKPREVLQKYVSQSFLGFDKKGHPIRYCALGAIDNIGLFKSTNTLYLLQHVLRVLEIDREACKQQSKKLGRNINQSVFIFNMDKFSFVQATHKLSLKHFMRGVNYFQDNYPETLDKVYIINASVYFTLGYSVVKTVLAPALIDKIHFHGQNGWKEELLKIIDEDVLPAFLGGNRTDPDGNPLCLSFINHGGTIPESYYLVKDIEKTAQKPGMKHIRLERQSSTRISIHIEKPMSILNWEFETKCYDIGFGITFEARNEKPEDIFPIFIHETDVESVCGRHPCNKQGKYTIVFDNSYSWLHTKDIYYRTWVTDMRDN